ncbi:MAG: hypothetical protein U0031_23965 [Thermomicrobiales bacterium]
MTTHQPCDGDDAKIVPLFPAEEEQASAALSRYWDATVRGQSIDTEELDADLKTIVHLLRHYHTVTRREHGTHPALRSLYDDLPAPPERGTRYVRRQKPAFYAPIAALAMMGVFILLFAFNTLASPRSWLLSEAADPDWIPWISDEWLGFRL